MSYCVSRPRVGFIKIPRTWIHERKEDAVLVIEERQVGAENSTVVQLLASGLVLRISIRIFTSFHFLEPCIIDVGGRFIETSVIHWFSLCVSMSGLIYHDR